MGDRLNLVYAGVRTGGPVGLLFPITALSPEPQGPKPARLITFSAARLPAILHPDGLECGAMSAGRGGQGFDTRPRGAGGGSEGRLSEPHKSAAAAQALASAPATVSVVAPLPLP
jgi:hypothetical protein